MKSRSQGFTLMELIIAMVIVGVLASIALPNFANSFDQARAKDAVTNLLAIYTAQVNYRNNNATFWPPAGVCDNIPPASFTDQSIAMNLGLTISVVPNGMKYCCDTATATTFTCYAQRSTDPRFYLTLVNNPPVVPPSNPGGNPACVSPTAGICP